MYLVISLLFLVFGTAANARSPLPQTTPQTEQMLASYEGQNVTAIDLAGRPDLDTRDFLPLFVQKVGEPFSKQKVEETIAALKKTGKFEEIRLRVLLEPKGVRVLLILEPAYYVGVYRFPGKGWFSYSRLLQVAGYLPTTVYNQSDIQEAQQALLNYCRQEGYFQAQVSPETQLDEAHKIANVIFHIQLGKRADFGKVIIAGVSESRAAELSGALRTLWARLRGVAIRPGKGFRQNTVTKAVDYLQGRLQDKGYLAAKVQLVGAEYHKATNRADIHYSVQTGPIVHVKIEGAHIWSWDRKSLLPIYQGVGVNRELVQEGNHDLESYFQRKGYFDVKSTSSFQRGTSAVTIAYDVDKGSKKKVDSVRIIGNKNESTGTLMNHVAVKKEHLFSRGQYSQKLVRESANNLTGVYQADGFSSVKVTPEVRQEGKKISVTFKIDEGARDIVRSLKIEGAETLPEKQFAPQGLKLAVGQPYSQSLVEADRKQIVARYLELGYLTANFRETAKEASKQNSHQIDVVYHIHEGPRVFADQVITLGKVHTKQKLIDLDVKTIQPGKPLTETELLRSESKLYDHPGVFDWAEVDPKRRVTTQDKEDVLVKVHEAKRNQITYGFGFEVINRGGNIPSGTVAFPNFPPIGVPTNIETSQQTFYGPRGTFQYTRNNMRGTGESLSLTAFAGRLDQRGGIFYIDPHFNWSKWSSTLALTAEHNAENPLFTSQQETSSYQFQRPLDPAKTRFIFFRYSFSKTDLTEILIPDLVLPEDQHVRLSTVSTSFTRDTRDSILDAHKGILESLELDLTSTKLGASVDFAKLSAQVAYYKKIPWNIIWANSIRIGLAQPFAGSDVPLSEEFFTGGGSTLRGYPLDGAGPQRQVQVCPEGQTTDCPYIQVPEGGHELLLLNSEFRIPLPIKKNLGLVVFYDGGNVFPHVGFHQFTSLYSNNVGLGLRYETPVGPIRVDVGQNLNPVPGIKPTQYFISIGQAF